MSKTHHKFNYIEFPVRDMAATKAFYGTVFGWSFVDYGPDYAGISGAGIDGGFDANAGTRGPSDQGALVILHSDDVEASEAAIRKAGAEISVPIFSFPGGRRFHFKDPNGNEVGVWSSEESS